MNRLCRYMYHFVRWVCVPVWLNDFNVDRQYSGETCRLDEYECAFVAERLSNFKSMSILVERQPRMFYQKRFKAINLLYEPKNCRCALITLQYSGPSPSYPGVHQSPLLALHPVSLILWRPLIASFWIWLPSSVQSSRRIGINGLFKLLTTSNGHWGHWRRIIHKGVDSPLKGSIDAGSKQWSSGDGRWARHVYEWTLSYSCTYNKYLAFYYSGRSIISGDCRPTPRYVELL